MTIDDYEEMLPLSRLPQRALSKAAKNKNKSYLTKREFMRQGCRNDGKIVVVLYLQITGGRRIYSPYGGSARYRKETDRSRTCNAIKRLDQGIDKTHIFCYQNNTGPELLANFGFKSVRIFVFPLITKM